MAAGDVIGSKSCSRCGGLITYRETKSGGASGACDGCKRQTFDRSPKAVTGLKAFLAELAGKPAQEKGAKKSWWDSL